jgi:hypothetical protein
MGRSAKTWDAKSGASKQTQKMAMVKHSRGRWKGVGKNLESHQCYEANTAGEPHLHPS